jgi:hypothetical protein
MYVKSAPVALAVCQWILYPEGESFGLFKSSLWIFLICSVVPIIANVLWLDLRYINKHFSFSETEPSLKTHWWIWLRYYIHNLQKL